MLSYLIYNQFIPLVICFTKTKIIFLLVTYEVYVVFYTANRKKKELNS